MPLAPLMMPRVGKSGPGQVLHQALDRDVGVVEHRDGRVDDLADVVRRDVRGHADRDAGAAVDEEVREARRQHRRLGLGLVVVRREVDRLAVDVGQELPGDLRHARLGVAHGGRGVAVDRAEVALPVDQHVAHAERLGHAHHRVVDGRIPVGVVFPHDVADDAGGLSVRAVPLVAALVHRVQDAPVHGLQAVPDVRQGAGHDDAHRVVEERLPHLVLEIDRQDFLREIGHAGGLGSSSARIEI